MTASALIDAQQIFAGTQASNASIIASQVLDYVSDLLDHASITVPKVEPVEPQPMGGLATDIQAAFTTPTLPSAAIPFAPINVPPVALDAVAPDGRVPSAQVPPVPPIQNTPPAPPPSTLLHKASVNVGDAGLESVEFQPPSYTAPAELKGPAPELPDATRVDLKTASPFGTSVAVLDPSSIATTAQQRYDSLSVDYKAEINTAVLKYLTQFADGWVETSDLMQTLAGDIMAGGSFLDVAAERSMYNRISQRIDVESRANQKQVTRAARKRGFEVPQFAMIAALNQVGQADSDRRAVAATEVAVEMTKLKVEMLNTTLNATSQLKQAAINAVMQYAEVILRLRESAASTATTLGRLDLDGNAQQVARVGQDNQVYSAQLDWQTKMYGADIDNIRNAVATLGATTQHRIAAIQASVQHDRNQIDAAQAATDAVVRDNANRASVFGAVAQVESATEGHSVEAQRVAVQAQGNAVEAQKVAVQAQGNAVEAQRVAVQAQGNTVGAMNARASALGHVLSATSQSQGHQVGARGVAVQAEANAIRRGEIQGKLAAESRQIQVQSANVSAQLATALLDATARTNIATAEMENRSKIAVAQVSQGVAEAMSHIAAAAMSSINGLAYSGEVTQT